MQVVGRGLIQFHKDEEERPHGPGKEDLWQESFVLLMWDTDKEVYVFFRLSQVPNKDGGQTTVMLTIWSPGYMYKHTDDAIPLKMTDRTNNSLTSGPGLCRYEFNGNFTWTLRDGEVEADLTMEAHHAGMSYTPGSAQYLAKTVIPNHTEAHGWVTGTVTIKGKSYSVAGPGWRDHSWGNRDWHSFRAHRFFTAMFGDNFHIWGLSFLGADGKLIKSGVVIRDDKIQFTEDFEIVAYMGEDGVSNLGGRMTLHLDAKKYVLDFLPVGKAAISMIHDFALVDSLCKVRMEDKVGVGLAETSHNAQGGKETPHTFPSAPGVIASGLFEV